MIESWLLMSYDTIYKITVRALHKLKSHENRGKQRRYTKEKKNKKRRWMNAWIVLMGGLLIFLRWALISFNFLRWSCGRNVVVLLIGWEWTGQKDETTRREKTRTGRRIEEEEEEEEEESMCFCFCCNL